MRRGVLSKNIWEGASDGMSGTLKIGNFKAIFHHLLSIYCLIIETWDTKRMKHRKPVNSVF
jgi:hypothetical protein